MEKSNNSQTLLKALLILQALALLAYTIYVGTNEGWNFLQVTKTNIFSMGWNGQFALDFSCYLVLSGVWIMWRNKFSATSILIALIAMIIGIIVFAPYLLYLLLKENGNIEKVLVGDRI